MTAVRTAAFGSWKSPITPDLIVAETIGLGDIVLDGATAYWVESRPAEAGRSVIMRHPAQGRDKAITPPEYSVLSRVHEYGGGAFTVYRDTVYFVNLTDQGIYRQHADGPPQPLLVVAGLRFADLLVDPAHDRLICVCEDHRGGGEARNTLCALALDGTQTAVTTLATGADFYASPALSDNGRQLAWLSWNHPDMPWDGTELWAAGNNTDGSLDAARRIAGGRDESIFQPQWGPDGALYFVSDRSGWWNLYRWRAGHTEALAPMAAEFGLPQWVFSMSTYGFTGTGDLICAYTSNGLWQLAKLNAAGELQPLPLAFTSIDEITCQGERVVFRAGSPTQASAIVELNLADGQIRTLRRSSTLDIDPGYISPPEAIEFPTGHGLTAHAFYYPPVNRDFRAPAAERPPLLVKSHGGPTSATSAVLNLGVQYWTSRGFALLDVNYGGSTGYGRAYQQRLDGQWGVVDVADCTAAARYAIDIGRADAARCAIRGSSAGGYTTLAALAFHDLFQAGASYYGISDLETLATDTHKFESRYLDRLIGPYPEAREIYRARSPIHHAAGLSVPVIFFQGLEDAVVPPDQAERMATALREKGVPVAYLPFPGERHGFRKAETIQRTLEAELYFYSRLFGFEPADPVAPVAIENL